MKKKLALALAASMLLTMSLASCGSVWLCGNSGIPL